MSGERVTILDRGSEKASLEKKLLNRQLILWVSNRGSAQLNGPSTILIGTVGSRE